MHPQLSIHHGRFIPRWPHLTRPYWVVYRMRRLPNISHQPLIIYHILAGIYLPLHILPQRRVARNLPRHLHPRQQGRPIRLIGQIIGLDERRIQRIGRAQFDVAATARP